MPRPQIAPTDYNEARTKARMGKRDWIAYRDRDGVQHFAVRSPATIKAAMLACGTARKFSIIEARSGVSMLMNWRMGVTMIRNAKFGC